MTDIPSGYTPGPWFASDEPHVGVLWRRFVNDSGNNRICFMPHSGARAVDAEANARLIALAPEMADEIVRLRAEVERLKNRCDTIYSNLDAEREEIVAEASVLRALNAELLEGLKLADATLSGANMNRSIVQKKVAAAIAKADGRT